MSGKRGDDRPPVRPGMPDSTRDPSSGRREGAGRDKAHSGRREKREWIGRQLRSVYDEVVQEPIPDSLKDLLTRLDSSEKDRS